MEIRILEEPEILPALHLVWHVFVQEVAPCYTPEGIRGFQDFIQYDHIKQMEARGELILFGAVDQGTVVGVLAFTPQGFIRLFYVEATRQGQGIGRMLFEGVYRYCVNVLHVEMITVHAAPGAVEKYEHLGMQAIDQEVMQDGKRFVPMEMAADPDRARHMKPKRKTSTIVLMVAAVVLLLALLVGGFLFIRQAYRFVNQQDQEAEPGDEDDFWEGLPDSGSDSQAEAEELDALADVPAHVDSECTYEIGEDTYTYNGEGEETQNTVIQFDVRYPTVKGLPGTLDETVNQAISDCALATVDLIYTNPSTEVKERVLQEDYPVLVSCLSYKVCYASEDFFSVAFTGFSYQGSWEAYHSELRTLNVDLTDGSVYTVPDIVDLDEDFLSAWLAAMQKEADNTDLLSELSTKDMEKALRGDSLDGVYQVAFFADDVGVEIGFCFNYPADDDHDQGYAWVTAPFTFDEIHPFETDSRFWQSLD